MAKTSQSGTRGKSAAAPGQKKKVAGVQSARSFAPAATRRTGPMPGGKPTMGSSGTLAAKTRPPTRPSGQPNPLQLAARAIGTGRSNALAGLGAVGDLAGKGASRAMQGINSSYGGSSISDAMNAAPQARKMLNRR